uniref:NADH-ubiquinone oxidoreductase chain 2 n=1 Tax=Sinohyriopsis cumingii TaxID=165450 RepID=A0A0C4G396_SINCU|nr:NADH dehydrogenase subunit 2 [Sinohyriopsis cumingii]
MLMWMMLELNTLTFIPLMQSTKSTTSVETSIKYLIPQTFASGLLMTSIILANTAMHSNMLATTALLLKLGSVPFHGWFPAVMQSINLTPGFTLMTWQKVAPLLLLTTPELCHPYTLMFSATLSALWGSIAGLNQTNLLSLMTFSSIAHLSWLLMGSLFNPLISLMYLILYSLTILPIFISMRSPLSTTHRTAMATTTYKQPDAALILWLLSLASLPPFAMFSAKLPIITLTTKLTVLPLIFLLLSTSISLYFYLSLSITFMFSFLSQSKLTIKPNDNKKPWEMTLMLLQLSTLPLNLVVLPMMQ